MWRKIALLFLLPLVQSDQDPLLAIPSNDHGVKILSPHPQEARTETKVAYSYEYAVRDAKTGNDFGVREKRRGDSVMGEYHVALPDGRIQTVTYSSDAHTGFVARVSYSRDGKEAPKSERSHATHVPLPPSPAPREPDPPTRPHPGALPPPDFSVPQPQPPDFLPTPSAPLPPPPPPISSIAGQRDPRPTHGPVKNSRRGQFLAHVPRLSQTHPISSPPLDEQGKKPFLKRGPTHVPRIFKRPPARPLKAPTVLKHSNFNSPEIPTGPTFNPSGPHLQPPSPNPRKLSLQPRTKATWSRPTKLKDRYETSASIQRPNVAVSPLPSPPPHAPPPKHPSSKEASLVKLFSTPIHHRPDGSAERTVVFKYRYHDRREAADNDGGGNEVFDFPRKSAITVVPPPIDLIGDRKAWEAAFESGSGSSSVSSFAQAKEADYHYKNPYHDYVVSDYYDESGSGGDVYEEGSSSAHAGSFNPPAIQYDLFEPLASTQYHSGVGGHGGHGGGGGGHTANTAAVLENSLSLKLHRPTTPRPRKETLHLI